MNVNINMNESIILEKDSDGNFVNKLKSNLSESFLVVDKEKDIRELNRNQYNRILDQNTFHTFNNAVSYINRMTNLGSIFRYASAFSSFFN